MIRLQCLGHRKQGPESVPHTLIHELVGDVSRGLARKYGSSSGPGLEHASDDRCAGVYTLAVVGGHRELFRVWEIEGEHNDTNEDGAQVSDCHNVHRMAPNSPRGEPDELPPADHFRRGLLHGRTHRLWQRFARSHSNEQERRARAGVHARHSGFLLERQAQDSEKEEDHPVHAALDNVQLSAIKVPLVTEELPYEAVHERIEDHRRGLLPRVVLHDDFHYVAALTRRVNPVEVENECSDWSPSPCDLALLSEQMPKHTRVTQLRGELCEVRGATRRRIGAPVAQLL
eukprot:5590178-Prymnesium_polylepis.1